MRTCHFSTSVETPKFTSPASVPVRSRTDVEKSCSHEGDVGSTAVRKVPFQNRVLNLCNIAIAIAIEHAGPRFQVARKRRRRQVFEILRPRQECCSCSEEESRPQKSEPEVGGKSCKSGEIEVEVGEQESRAWAIDGKCAIEKVQGCGGEGFNRRSCRRAGSCGGASSRRRAGSRRRGGEKVF